jgi:hypothetical protein
MVYALLLVAVTSCSGADDGLRAGAAKVDITPPVGYPLWGYSVRRDNASEGVLDPLQARALVLTSGTQQLALVSLDLGRSPTRASMARIRAEIKKAGIDHVFLVASHTHSGPVLELDDWPSVEKSYVRTLEKKLVALILEAKGSASPCKLGTATRLTDFNRNRHSRLLEKPVDHELLVLRVEGLDGKPIAHAVNFAAHPTLLPSRSLKFSADYPGVLAQQVEKHTSVPCLFLQGAAGDLSPNTLHGGDPNSFGSALAKDVLAMLETIRCENKPHPRLDFRDETFTFRSRVNLSNPFIAGLYSSVFFPSLVAFYEREYREGIRPRLDVALLDGSIGFVGVSGEFFCSHALNLKRRARLNALFFLGYCNDYQQYFPTIEASAQGGYGADVTVSPVETGAGERMMDRALIYLYQMRGQLPVMPGKP